MKDKIFISIIWGYAKYFYNFAEEEHYHLHVLKIAKEMGYKTMILLRAKKEIIENDPKFDSETEIIYYSNIFDYLLRIIKYSFLGAVFYVNSVEPQSLIVPFLAKKTIFMGHTHPVRQNWIKQRVFNFSMSFFSKIRLNNDEEKDFLLKQKINKEKLYVVPLSVSLKEYKILDNKIIRKDLVYFGNITKKKNLETIIRAINIICKKYPGIILHLIGTEYDQLNDSLINSNLIIVRHGFKPPAEANVLLNQFLICINSSINEGMCVSIYNAALAGCALCLPKIMSFTGIFKDKALFHEVMDHEQLAKNIFYYLENSSVITKYNQQTREMIKNEYNYQKISEKMKLLFTF